MSLHQENVIDSSDSFDPPFLRALLQSTSPSNSGVREICLSDHLKVRLLHQTQHSLNRISFLAELASFPTFNKHIKCILALLLTDHLSDCVAAAVLSVYSVLDDGVFVGATTGPLED